MDVVTPIPLSFPMGQNLNVRIDEVFFLGGIEKSEVLKAFGVNIFFDDQSTHTDPASKLVPAARVPYKTV